MSAQNRSTAGVLQTSNTQVRTPIDVPIALQVGFAQSRTNSLASELIASLPPHQAKLVNKLMHAVGAERQLARAVVQKVVRLAADLDLMIEFGRPA
jgi:hypothetical protein